MSLQERWTRLEAEAPREQTGRMIQRLHPESSIDLFASLETGPAGTRRAVELQISAELVVDLEPPAGSGGVEFRVEAQPPGRAALVLALREAGADELFAAMCEDVIAAAAACGTEEEALGVWIGRFAKWRRMLRGGARGLSPERQRGLYAELRTIREHLIPVIGFDEAVRAWRGPDGAPRDFEVNGRGVEVKASAANEPQVVPINGERQLDDAGLEALYLLHESLEVFHDAGETLPRAVQSLRVLADGRPEAGAFEDRLVQCGYADVHEPLYRRTGYEIKRTSVFHVSGDFPRITESGLTDGVGAVHYRLAIDACRDHEVDAQVLGAAISTTGGRR